MTKNFDKAFKNCLNEMQQPAQDPSKDPLLQSVVANMSNPVLRKAIEDTLKKIQQTQPKPAPQQPQTPQQNQSQPKPAAPQQTPPQGQQQPNNNAANKPV